MLLFNFLRNESKINKEKKKMEKIECYNILKIVQEIVSIIKRINP